MEDISSLQIEVKCIMEKIDQLQQEKENMEKKRKELLQKVHDLKDLIITRTDLEKDQKDVSLKYCTSIKISLHESSIQRKCKYYNRGFCKFGNSCTFFHSLYICQDYLNSRICQERGCRKRHPKQCRYWSKNDEGCHRQDSCMYLHLKPPKYQPEELEIISSSENILYSCDKCELNFSLENELKEHTELSHKDFDYSCNKCDQKLESKMNMKTHILTHHEEKQQTCEHCGKIFKSLRGLRMHATKTSCGQLIERINLSNNNYSCHFCDFKANSKESHKSHTDRHVKYTNLCKNYPMFKFSFRNDIITWDEYGLFLPNESSVYQRDVIATDVDTFEDQVDRFFRMRVPSGNKMNGKQVENICSSSLWHFETEETECSKIICQEANQQLCLKVYQCFGVSI